MSLWRTKRTSLKIFRLLAPTLGAHFVREPAMMTGLEHVRHSNVIAECRGRDSLADDKNGCLSDDGHRLHGG